MDLEQIQDSAEYRELLDCFKRTDFNWPFSDCSISRSRGQVAVRKAKKIFKRFAERSTAHAILASMAWDHATDVINPPEGYVHKRNRVANEGTLTRKANVPVEMADLFQKFNELSEGYDTSIVLEATINFLVAAINVHTQGDPNLSEALATGVGTRLPELSRYQLTLVPQPTDITVHKKGH